MDKFDNIKWDNQRASAPEGMYDQVRQRILHERIRIAKTQRQLVIGSALLLVIGGINIGVSLLKYTQKEVASTKNTEQILYETYFDNTTTLSNEK
jgi:hypothetical protein